MTDRPSTFEEVRAAEDPAERERMERAETFMDAGIVSPGQNGSERK
jgi:hypothetical protein